MFQLQGASRIPTPDFLTRSFVPGPHWGLHFQTPITKNKVQLTQRERATVVRVCRPTVNQSKVSDFSNGHSTR